MRYISTAAGPSAAAAAGDQQRDGIPTELGLGSSSSPGISRASTSGSCRRSVFVCQPTGGRCIIDVGDKAFQNFR
ncbi:MAG UNVERIFIED_CONTAM: hypothetical protein LVR18_18070 [Planctomycetaceae bacterium]